jgi:tRNA U34 5-methylaminomethyl-2-thiouridine-forming methyltransferase MnmC
MRFTDNANIEWGHVEWKQGQPYASAFQDVYFSSDNGLLETEYVFVQGNNLSNRWQQTKTFTIAETGFGTGLNFLCAARTWLDTAPKNAVLHFISVEKYPLNLPDITSALQLWPELLELAEPFLASYENLLIGTEPVMLFDNRVQLTLLVGDATVCLKSFNLRHSCPPVDAWFLDGFAPAKNPDMWQVELFEQMARLSTQASTFSTFTSAGAVRRGLLAAGFEVTKQSGFGKKREMLLGRFIGNTYAA